MLNTKGLTIIAVLLVASAVGTILLAGYVNSTDPTAHEQAPVLFIKDLSLINNTESLNGSFALVSADGRAIEVNEFRINRITLDKVSGLTVYVNGTSINYLAPSLLELKPGDTMDVNLIIPNENNSDLLSALKSNHFEIQVCTPQALFWGELK